MLHLARHILPPCVPCPGHIRITFIKYYEPQINNCKTSTSTSLYANSRHFYQVLRASDEQLQDLNIHLSVRQRHLHHSPRSMTSQLLPSCFRCRNGVFWGCTLPSLCYPAPSRLSSASRSAHSQHGLRCRSFGSTSSVTSSGCLLVPRTLRFTHSLHR